MRRNTRIHKLCGRIQSWEQSCVEGFYRCSNLYPEISSLQIELAKTCITAFVEFLNKGEFMGLLIIVKYQHF
jgi:hypothetical protein